MVRPLTLGYLTLDAAPLITIEAAAAAGFASVGIRLTGRRLIDPYHRIVGNGPAIRDIRQRLDDLGIRLSNVNAYSLFPDVSASSLEPVVEAAAALGSPTIVAICNQPDRARFGEVFGKYCEMAGKYRLRVALEFMKFSEIKTLSQAVRVVEEFGAPDTGVLIDALHFYRSGGLAADLSGVDRRRISHFQLCDGPTLLHPTEEEMRTESRSHRLAPGDGAIPLRDFLNVLPEEIEVEYEVPMPQDGGGTPEHRAQVAFRNATHFLSGLATPRSKT